MESRKNRIWQLLLVISVLAGVFLGWRLHTVTRQEARLEWTQQRVDQEFVQGIVALHRSLYWERELDWERAAGPAAVVQALYKVTTYAQIDHMEDLALWLVRAQQNPETHALTEELEEEFSYVLSGLGKPLAADMDERSTALWAKLEQRDQ